MHKPNITSSNALKFAISQFRGGPITLAEYMSEVLTNASAGYYTRRDVFGTAGDFITSPEISQMFGEMIGIWCVSMWQQMNSPKTLRLVELGPGRGTLMADLLRSTSAFSSFSSSLSVSMVEISPVLRQIQWDALGCEGEFDPGSTTITGSTKSGVIVTWHRSLDDVPDSTDSGPALYIAHEFIDALPVHQFQKSDRGWSERLVNEAPPNSPYHFQMVLSPGPTPASRTMLPLRLEGLDISKRTSMDSIEICPQGMATAEALGKRVAAHGGAALLIDYGQDGPYRGSLQAIKDHSFVNLFHSPGDADLSAWVDFGALKVAVESSGATATVHGPISQSHLLHGLGIQARLQQLLETASEAEAEALITGYLRLVSGSAKKGGKENEKREGQDDDEVDEPDIDGMGESYQAVCITPKGAPAPVPFTAE